MFTDLRRHKLDYSLMAVIAAVFTFLFLAKRNEPSYLLYLTIGFAASYLLWGVWHHLRLRDLTGKIVLEYFFVGVLAVVIVSTLLL